MFGIILSKLESVEDRFIYFYLYFSMFCLFISFITSLSSYIPRLLKLNKRNKSNNNLYYFGFVKTLKVEELKNELNNTDLNNHLLSQNITMSAIVDRKFKLFNFAVKIFLGAIIPLYFVYWLVKVIVVNSYNKKLVKK